MSWLAEIGEVEEVGRIGAEELSVEWRIQDVLSLSGGDGEFYWSPDFRIGDERWRLIARPNWETSALIGWLTLGVRRCDEGPPKKFRFSIGIRGGNEEIEVEKELGGVGDYFRRDVCCLMSDGVMSITCVLKRLGGDRGVWSHPRPPVEVVPTERKSQSSDKRGFSGGNEACLRANDAKGFGGSNRRGLGNLGAAENEVLRAEMKTLTQKIADYVKSNEGYCSEISSYKCKIKDLENKLLLDEKNYEETIQTTLNEFSKTRKENDLLIKEVESFMGQTKTQQKTIENYELESENYKKQISALESEKLSIAVERRSMLGEKLTIVSRLEKDNDLLKREVEFFMEQAKTLQKRVESYQLESENFRNQDIVEKEDKISGLKRVHLKDVDSPSRSIDSSFQDLMRIPSDIGALSCDFSDLYADEIHPNFVLTCNEWNIPVNTFVLSVRSSYFREMFRNMEQENWTGFVDIKDLEVPVLVSMLKFLYCGKLVIVSEDTVATLYEAGDKYACSLKEACCRWMERNFTRENCVSFLRIADSHSDQDLRAAVVSFIISNPGVMKTPTWLAYSDEQPKLANDVQQAYISSIIP